MAMRRGSLIGLILLILMLGAGGRALWVWLDQPIERVSISGEFEHVNSDYLKARLAPFVKGESWLSVDLNELRQRVRRIDWLSEVRISRKWPNALVFELFEQHPVARWGDEFLLNEKGEPFAFAPLSPPVGLPDLAGPPGSGPEVLAYYDTLRRRLAPLAIQLTQLRLEPRGAWRLQFDDDVWVMLGRSDREERLDRLYAAWQRRLSEQVSHIRYIDLRYPNGVAVAWHGETEIDD
ncbi:cell division protein FtsQ/DivIB [Pistricoccus aurantiacus]|uniref:cell division protein FtsQ/DivIB n=1 Tax=Pistricoccus aurantiacus TaxID=1883414 RepID=UPI00362D145D